jgi:hypothetical protein
MPHCVIMLSSDVPPHRLNNRGALPLTDAHCATSGESKLRTGCAGNEKPNMDVALMVE